MNRNSDDAEFPPLVETFLTAEQLDALLSDWLSCAAVWQIVVKPLSGLSTHRRTPLDHEQWRNELCENVRQLQNGNLRGLQVSYRFDQTEWIDTLSRRGEGIRLIRMRIEEKESR